MMSDKDKQQQAAIFGEALETYEERTESRGQLWKQFDASDPINHMKSKVARAEYANRQLELGEHTGSLSEDTLKEEAIDSCIDIINYAAFTIRHLRDEK